MCRLQKNVVSVDVESKVGEGMEVRASRKEKNESQ